MGKFKEFLQENNDTLQSINDILDELSPEEIDSFGDYLYDVFFDADYDDNADNADSDMGNMEHMDEPELIDLDELKSMINDLGEDFYDEILDLLSTESFNDEADLDDLEEGVSRIMKKANLNKTKRKFMSKSKAELRKTAASRKKDNRSSRASRKRYQRANKQKIKSYQKSRSAAIKKGSHKVKLRRKTG